MSPADPAPRTILLNPGPVTLSTRVRHAMTRADLCHREPDFLALQAEVRLRLGRIYPEAEEGWVPILLTGSGTGAVEAMVGSLVPADGRALVLVNGVYGERMVAMLVAQRKPHAVLAFPWDAPFDVERVEASLHVDPGITHVLAVHHETTTGRLNPVGALGDLCRRRGVALLLDAVSSFGAEEIRFASWNLEAVAATANKCLHGVPGIAPVLVRRSVFESRATGATSVYLDLFRYGRDGAASYPPFTPAVQSMLALDEALREFEEGGGWRARRDRYRCLARKVSRGLADLGIQPFLETGASSCVLTSYRLPANLDYESLHDGLRAGGFIIYAGQGPFSGSIFRISTMGDVTDADLDRLLACFDDTLRHGPNPGDT